MGAFQLNGVDTSPMKAIILVGVYMIVRIIRAQGCILS